MTEAELTVEMVAAAYRNLGDALARALNELAAGTLEGHRMRVYDAMALSLGDVLHVWEHSLLLQDLKPQ